MPKLNDRTGCTTKPTVHARDGWWYEKHPKAEVEKERAEHAKAEEEHGGIHMPYGSIWPFVASLGLLIGAIAVSALDSNPAPGIHLKLGLSLVGGVVMFIGIYFWSLEGNEGYHIHLDKVFKVIGEDHGGKH